MVKKNFMSKILGVFVFATFLTGLAYNPGRVFDVEDLADGTANHVLGWNGSGVAVSQSRDGARVTHGSNQTISTGTNTILAFNSEIFDDNALHDTVTNNSRLTAVVEGRYWIACNVSWQGSTTGTREVHIKLNGSALISLEKSGATTNDLLIYGTSIIYNLAATDYVECEVWQNTGSNRTINSVGNYSPLFMMQRLRSQ